MALSKAGGHRMGPYVGYKVDCGYKFDDFDSVGRTLDQ
jgi:hypothetical protein